MEGITVSSFEATHPQHFYQILKEPVQPAPYSLSTINNTPFLQPSLSFLNEEYVKRKMKENIIYYLQIFEHGVAESANQKKVWVLILLKKT